MCEKILKTKALTAAFLLISVFAVAQPSENPTIIVYVDRVLVQDYSVRILKKHDCYKLKLRTSDFHLSSKIPEYEYCQIDSIVIRGNSSTDAKRKVEVSACVKYNQRLSIETCIICDDRNKYYYSSIEIWHPIGYRSMRP